jgi:hypothetical protein
MNGVIISSKSQSVRLSFHVKEFEEKERHPHPLIYQFKYNQFRMVFLNCNLKLGLAQ